MQRANCRSEAVGAAVRTDRVADQHELGGSSGSAFFFNPFMDLEVTYVAGMPCLIAVFDRHEHSEKDFPNDGNLTARSGNSTARGGNVPS